MRFSSRIRISVSVAAVAVVSLLIFMHLRGQPAKNRELPAAVVVPEKAYISEPIAPQQPATRKPVLAGENTEPRASETVRVVRPIRAAQSTPEQLPRETQVVAAAYSIPQDSPALSSVHTALINRDPNDEVVQAFLAKHEELEKEPRTSWGLNMENNLADYVGKRSGSSGVEVLSASCRTTRCEIQAADALPSGPGVLDSRGFFRGLHRQSRAWSEIEDWEVYMTKIDGRTVYWAFSTAKQ